MESKSLTQINNFSNILNERRRIKNVFNNKFK